MLTKKEEDWSEDEQKLVKEYEKKVKDLQEEREKYHKVCNTNNRIIIMERYSKYHFK